MNEIIKINFESEEPTVSARDLHEGLGIKSNFTTWFGRMCEYGFTESDYSVMWSDSKNGNAVEFEKSTQFMSAKGFTMDAQISIDMAKQICMIQRTDKGKRYRQYFLDLEKSWNTPELVMARALKMADRTINDLKGEIEQKQEIIDKQDEQLQLQEPFVKFSMIVQNGEDGITMDKMAAVLCKQGL